VHTERALPSAGASAARIAAAAPSGAGPSAGWRDTALTALLLLCLLAWDASGADLRVVQWFGSPTGFAWRDHALTASALHTGGRWLSGVLLVGVVMNAVRPFRFARGLPSGARWWWLATTLACLLLIPFIKSRSHISCPWDLTQFGGSTQWLSHADWRAWVAPGDGGPGRCFPSGHASGAFSFLAGWFGLRGTAPRAARAWLAAVLALGLLFGVAQLARGAHYPSHTLWTAWICWAVSAAAWHSACRAGMKEC
jgi:membrane-associated PAP2 superfamily phosphatase